MFRRHARAAVAAAALLSTVAAATVAPQTFADTPSVGPVLFSDTFDGAAGSGPGANWWDYSTATYDSSAAFGNVRPGGDMRAHLDGVGHLVIPATPSQGTAIRSHFRFEYGYMDAVMELPSLRGSWPAFWTLNNVDAGGPATDANPVGEVDAMEAYTRSPNVTHANGHSYGGSREFDSADNFCPAAQNIDVTQWHDYGAKIEPGKVTFYLDGVQCGAAYTKDPAKVWGLGPDQTRGNFMLLQNAVGGAGGQNPPGAALGDVLVDSVTVRALNTTSAPIVDGARYTIVNTCGAKALAAPGASKVNSVALRTANPVAGDTSQEWTIVHRGNVSAGRWTLLNVNSRKSAKVSGASTANGAAVIQYTDSGTLSALWIIAPGVGGQYRIANVYSGKNLDVRSNSTAAGTSVNQSTPSNACGETWLLTKV